MTTLFYRHPRLLGLAIVMTIALGLTALLSVGRQEDPTITNIFATVVTPYPGATPERVEALVTEKLEARLREIAEIKNLDSTSGPGVSSVRIELSEFTPDDRIEQIWAEIRDAVEEVRPSLPDGVRPPVVDDDRIGAYTAILALTSADETRPASLATLGRAAAELQDRLRAVPGAQLVSLYGAPVEEVRVEVDPARLAAQGLTPTAVAQAIARADAKLSAGEVAGAEGVFSVEVAGALDGLDRVRDAVIRAEAGPEGDRVLRVGDVARVRRAEVEPPAELALSNGRRAVLVAARMEPDLQVDAFAAAIERTLVAFEAEIPGGVALERLFDQSGYTTARLLEVLGNLAAGVAVVVFVLVATLDWRSALNVALTIPLAALLSMFVLERLGVVVHQMSITGLIVALGLLVDSAIVVADDVRTRIARGLAPVAAVDAVVRRLAMPLLASTGTTLLAFAPLAVLPGPAGDFMGAIAISVMVMLVVSFLLALTVTPAIAALTAPRALAQPAPRRPGPLRRLHLGLLRASLAAKPAAALVAATPAILGFLAFPTLTAQFFPGVDRDQLHVEVTLAPGAAIAETEATVRRIDAALAAEPEVRAVAWSIGRSAPAFYYNMRPDRDADPAYAQALVTTASPEATMRLVSTMQARLDALAPEGQTLVRGLVQGPPVAAPVELRIYGPEIETLRAIGEAARVRLASLGAVTHARATLDAGAPKLVVALDEDAARRAGFAPTDAARALAGLLDGAVGGSVIEGSEELPVRVRAAADRRDAVERVLGLDLVGPSGAVVPVAAIARVALEPAETSITRRNGSRMNAVQAFLQPGVLPEEVVAEFRAALEADPLDLPPGYRLDWGGDSDARGEVVRNLLAPIGLVVTLSLAVVMATLMSWRLTGVAFVVAGLSIGLALLALAIFDYPFGVTALIGVIGSVGVSINAAIIVMSALEEDAAARLGDADAIVGVVDEATRHIVSTTLTTFGGFLPLVLAGGLFWPPFAMAIAGGVLLSTIVSLYFTPPVYALLVSGRGRAAARAASVGAEVGAVA